MTLQIRSFFFINSIYDEIKKNSSNKRRKSTSSINAFFPVIQIDEQNQRIMNLFIKFSKSTSRTRNRFNIKINNQLNLILIILSTTTNLFIFTFIFVAKILINLKIFNFVTNQFLKSLHAAEIVFLFLIINAFSFSDNDIEVAISYSNSTFSQTCSRKKSQKFASTNEIEKSMFFFHDVSWNSQTEKMIRYLTSVSWLML